MKKALSFAIVLMIFGLAVSCGPSLPKKELEDAQVAIEKAKSVDAGIFAASDIESAEADFNEATTLSSDKVKKYNEAKEKAISAKQKADTAFDIAVVARANHIYEEDQKLIEQAKQEYFANIIYTDRYSKGENDLQAVKAKIDETTEDKTNYIVAYDMGIELQSFLKQLIEDCAKLTDRVKNAINNAQNEYDIAMNDAKVKKYAMEDLQKANAPLEEARKLFEAPKSAEDFDSAATKAEEALALIKEARKKAEEAYEAYLKEYEAEYKSLEEARLKELEEEKRKAQEYLDKAKNKLEELKKLKDQKSGKLDPGVQKFSTVSASLIHLGKDIEIIGSSDGASNDTLDDSTDSDETISADAMEEEETNSLELQKGDTANTDVEFETSPDFNPHPSDEQVTIEHVEYYYKLAQEAYDAGQYLDSVDYSREAMRLADILASKEISTTYTVILNPKNRDCLWKIAGRFYNNKTWMWPIIWLANKEKIKDPDLIYPGQVFVIPPSLTK